MVEIVCLVVKQEIAAHVEAIILRWMLLLLVLVLIFLALLGVV